MDEGAVWGLVAMVVFAAVAFFVMWNNEQGLKDPNDKSRIPASSMWSSHCLPQGRRVSAVLMRQSGGVYRDLGTFDSASTAVAAVAGSFRKSGIDAVRVVQNTPQQYQVVRLHYSHKGKAEGKKMGGAILRVV